jgi:hypothetical protein
MPDLKKIIMSPELNITIALEMHIRVGIINKAYLAISIA